MPLPFDPADAARHEAAHAVVRWAVEPERSATRPLWSRIVIRTVEGDDPNLAGEPPACNGMVFDMTMRVESEELADVGADSPLEVRDRVRDDVLVLLAGMAAAPPLPHLGVTDLFTAVYLRRKTDPDSKQALARMQRIGCSVDDAGSQVEAIVARPDLAAKIKALTLLLLERRVVTWEASFPLLSQLRLSKPSPGAIS
jgi:hypothetical protein